MPETSFDKAQVCVRGKARASSSLCIRLDRPDTDIRLGNYSLSQNCRRALMELPCTRLKTFPSREGGPMQRGCAQGSGVRGAADWTTALVVFDALSRQPRLAVFRSALTLHLRCLAEAGLIHPRGGRSGKFVADLERLASALGVLVAERGQENA
jgi:hypothetical protein